MRHHMQGRWNRHGTPVEGGLPSGVRLARDASSPRNRYLPITSFGCGGHPDLHRPSGGPARRVRRALVAGHPLRGRSCSGGCAGSAGCVGRGCAGRRCVIGGTALLQPIINLAVGAKIRRRGRWHRLRPEPTFACIYLQTAAATGDHTAIRLFAQPPVKNGLPERQPHHPPHRTGQPEMPVRIAQSGQSRNAHIGLFSRRAFCGCAWTA